MSDATPTLKKGQTNPFVDALLEDAETLSEELRGKGGLYERIGANRDTLRQIKTTGFLSPAQRKKIDEYYPERATKADAKAADAKPAAKPAATKPAATAA